MGFDYTQELSCFTAKMNFQDEQVEFYTISRNFTVYSL